MEVILIIKNNLKALIIHITISFLSIFVSAPFFAGQPKWVSEEAARKHHYYSMIMVVIVIVTAVVSYYFQAKKHLKVLEGTKRILLSVSLPAILGTIFWLLAFIIDPPGKINSLLNSQLWQNYSMYNGYAVFFLDEAGINNPYVFLLFNFIPSIAMGSGLLYKSHTKNYKQNK